MIEKANGDADREYFLDGLRGWAALAVTLWHIFGQVFTYGPSAGATLGKLLLFDGIYIATVVGLHAAVLWLMPLRRFFESPLSRFLGRISFPLYLLHGPVMYSFSIAALHVMAPWAIDQAAGNVAIGLATLALSIVAALLFVPVNDASIALSRRFGVWATSVTSRSVGPDVSGSDVRSR